MPLLHFILVVCIVGVVMYLVNRFVPMAAGIKQFLNIAVIVILVIWLIMALFPGIGSYRMPAVGR